MSLGERGLDELSEMKAELARMRAAMKAVEEEKKRGEDAEVVKELRAKVEALYRNYWPLEHDANNECYKCVRTFLGQIDAREPILWMARDWNCTHVPSLLVTLQHVFIVRTVLGDNRSIAELMACPVYTFTSHPNVRQWRDFFWGNPNDRGSFRDQVSGHEVGAEQKTSCRPYHVATFHPFRQTFYHRFDGTGQREIPCIHYDQPNLSAEFEAVMRLTPGEYRNGGWRQVAGFFGPYVHTQTGELRKWAPEVEK